jgi:hypothetical protein
MFSEDARAAARAGKAPGGGPARAELKPTHLIAGLVLVCGLQNLLLFSFLGLNSALLCALYLAGLGTLLVALIKADADSAPRSTVLRFAACTAVSVALLAIGGEGRFFYSNLDWQVRDAVLGDMIRYSWPFAYTERGAEEVLRAPIGMYLVPALVGKMAGAAAADVALLLQNSVILGALLTLGSILFTTTKSRLGALVVFLLFSGMDVIGQSLLNFGKALDPISHLDGWLSAQYSSTVTLAFWVPQHAFVGWAGGILFLLWHRGLIRLSLFLTALPLLAIWSPLGLLGTMPFAAFAFLRTAWRRELSWQDVALPAGAAFLSLASLLYLQAGSEAVGAHFYPVTAKSYSALLALEVFPYLLPLWILSWQDKRIRPPLILVTILLLGLPFVRIGEHTDLMMRGSIPSLVILALMTGQALVEGSGRQMLRRAARSVLVVALAVGSITPAHELIRGISLRPSPPPNCTLLTSADRSILRRLYFGGGLPMSTYVTRVDEMPVPIRPNEPFRVGGGNPRECWDRPWMLRWDNREYFPAW